MLSKKIGMLFTFLDSALLPQLLNGLYGEGGDEMKGFYFAHRLTDEIGLSFAIVYLPQERGLQISLMFGCLMLAIGYNGKEVTT